MCADFPDVPQRIAAFIDQMSQQGKVLILGNVRSEDWNKVAFVPRLVLKNNNETCRQQVNKSLRQYCTPEQNCYVVDLDKIVYALNTTGELVLKSGQRVSGNRFHLFNEVRLDGISLSPWGVQVIVEDVLKSLSANPPRALTNNLLQKP